MATLQSGKCFTVPTFFGMCCRSEWQERMYIYKWHEVDQTKHEIFCVHIVCNEIQVKVNLEITTFFFYLRFPYCPNFFWFGVVLVSLENNATNSYSTLKCGFCVGMSVSVLVCVNPPTANLPNSILTPRVASWWKTYRIAAMESQQTNWVRDSRFYLT